MPDFIALRRKNGWSQVDLGRQLGVSPSAVAKWETGERQPAKKLLPKIEALERGEGQVFISHNENAAPAWFVDWAKNNDKKLEDLKDLMLLRNQIPAKTPKDISGEEDGAMPHAHA